MHAHRLANRLVIMPEPKVRSRRLMHLYFTYRILLSISLIVFSITGLGSSFLGATAPDIHIITILVYLVLSFASLGLSFFDLESMQTEYAFAIFVDSIVISVLLFTSGGAQSGLGILLGISIAFGAQGMPTRIALFSAAVATSAIFLEAYLETTILNHPVNSYTLLAMLGTSYFALALLSNELASRTQLSERLVQQQGKDIADLTELNDLVIHHMQTGVIVLDEKLHIRILNDAAWQFLGRPISTVGYALQQISNDLTQALEYWKQHPYSHQRHLHSHSQGNDLLVKFQRVGEGDKISTLIFMDDASKTAEAAQQLKLASLGKLVASIAHEIRNPLGAIGHASQLLQESEDLSGTDLRMTDIINRNTSRLNEVIENILSLSRQRTVEPKTIELQQWLKKLGTDLQHCHQLQPEQMVTYVSPQEARLIFDPQQVSQIINALVDNAVKHQADKADKLIISLTGGMDADIYEGYIEVIDNGENIPPDIVDKVFDPFFTTSTQGTGLGLYIVKELCDANNIRISYLSVSSGGNCFKLKFVLPNQHNS
jgi:two-component system sensor histidine kinase PilS (NtrC family)